MAKAATTIHLQDFADDHGVVIRTVTNWIAEGMPFRTHRGERRVVRKEANAWLLDRAKQKGRASGQAVEWDKDREMAMKIRVERQIKELDLATKRSSLLTVEEFDTLADRLIGGFSSVVSGQLQSFERDMGLEPAEARALVLRMQEALMRGAQELADTLDAEADTIAQLAAAEEEDAEESEDAPAVETADEVDDEVPGEIEVPGA